IFGEFKTVVIGYFTIVDYRIVELNKKISQMHFFCVQNVIKQCLLKATIFAKIAYKNERLSYVGVEIISHSCIYSFENRCDAYD
ncbi:hypothetical protein, partial [Priestia flexa]